MSRPAALSCHRCDACYPLGQAIDSRGCPACFDIAPSNLHLVYSSAPDRQSDSVPAVLPASLWRYADRLPFDEQTAISLGEGLTPLFAARRLGSEIGVPNLFIKNEGHNPTWSHKDRFSTVALTAAVVAGAAVVATSSTGNAGASLAAYAARAGLPCIVATSAGSSGPMISQIRKYGARVVAFERKADRWTFLTRGVERFGWFATSPYRHPVVGSHPIGIEGYKTIAFEIVEQMSGEVPDWCALPVCYGDALVGVWLGFRELLRDGAIARIPRLLAAEAHGSLRMALELETDKIPEVQPSFEALAVSVGATRSTFQALKALRETRGVAIPVGNDGLIAFQERIATTEGAFLELSSVMSVAAVAAARREGLIRSHETVISVVTASGLKDVDRTSPPETVHPFADIEIALETFEATGGNHSTA